MFILPNGNRIDKDMVELAMEDADSGNVHSLNTQTGEVVFISEYDASDEREKQLEEIETSSKYVPNRANPFTYGIPVDGRVCCRNRCWRRFDRW